MSAPGLRLDRLLSMVVFRPLRRVLGEGKLRLPVLMYHRICDDPEAGISPYYKVNTSPAVFRKHLQQLAKMGWQTMDLAAAAGMLARDNPLPPNRVIITFDDGFKDFFTHAYPALREHGFTATVFLPTAFIQEERRSFKGVECLTWEEVRLMRRAGIEFGSHTVNHPKLVDLPLVEVERELRDSKEQMEKQLAEKVDTFSYPYAFPQANRRFTEAFRDHMIRTGYSCCVTTEIGRVKAGDNPFRIKRLPINSLDDPRFFRAKLEGGYDWLATQQSLFKSLKAFFSVGGQQPRRLASESCHPVPARRL